MNLSLQSLRYVGKRRKKGQGWRRIRVWRICAISRVDNRNKSIFTGRPNEREREFSAVLAFTFLSLLVSVQGSALYNALSTIWVLLTTLVWWACRCLCFSFLMPCTWMFCLVLPWVSNRHVQGSKVKKSHMLIVVKNWNTTTSSRIPWFSPKAIVNELVHLLPNWIASAMLCHPFFQS